MTFEWRSERNTKGIWGRKRIPGRECMEIRVTGTEWAKAELGGETNCQRAELQKVDVKKDWYFSHKDFIFSYILKKHFGCVLCGEKTIETKSRGFCSRWELMVLCTKVVNSGGIKDEFQKRTNIIVEVYRWTLFGVWLSSVKRHLISTAWPYLSECTSIQS